MSAAIASRPRASAKADLVSRMNSVAYDPILRSEQKGTFRLPAWLHKSFGEEFISIETAAQ